MMLYITLAHEARIGVGIDRQLRRQELERDRAVELRVPGLIHDPHAALAEGPEDLVVGGARAGPQGVHVLRSSMDPSAR